MHRWTSLAPFILVLGCGPKKAPVTAAAASRSAVAQDAAPAAGGGSSNPAATSAAPPDECLNWAPGVSLKLNQEDGSTKAIFAIGEGIYNWDDFDERRDAINEATLDAKRKMSEFLTNAMSSEEKLDQMAREESEKIRNAEGVSSNVSKSKVKESILRIASQSETVLQGMVTLKDCNEWKETQGRAVVKMVWSPKTSAAAGDASQMMQDNAAGSSGNNKSGEGSGSNSDSRSSDSDY
jgi:vacuolar-type H+-ATPase subunit H